jgi:hypothetical protein
VSSLGTPWIRQQNPLRKSLIRLEARGLHPLGALVHTDARQKEGEARSGRINHETKTSTLGEPSARISDSPRGSGATPT